MKKRIQLLIGLTVVTLGILIINDVLSGETMSEIEQKRFKHQEFLANSPFKETLKMTRTERKAMGIPPNAYNEQVWELTMDPATGRPMTERALQVLEQLKSERGNYRGVGGDSNNAWVDRGPNNIGGRTRALMFDPNDVGAGNGDGIDYNRVFAGGVSGGLWVNDDITDANSSWSLVPGFASMTSVTVIISDPNDSNTFYLGSGESYTQGDAIGSGIWKSIDGGVNWTNVLGGLTGTSTPSGGVDQFINGIFYINDLVARDLGTTTELFASVASQSFVLGSSEFLGQWHSLSDRGLYKSTDSGVNWVKNALDGTDVNPNDIEIDINNNVWLATTSAGGISAQGGLIFRSTDGSLFELMGTISSASRTELEPDPSNADALWALANVGGQADVFSLAYNSGSNDVTITQITTEPEDADLGIPNTDFARGQAFYNLEIEADPDGNIIVGGIDLFRTANTISWSQISKWSFNNNLAALPVSLVHADHHAIVNRPGFPNEYIFGTDGGVFYCSDITAAAGSTTAIEARNKDYNTVQFYSGDISNKLEGRDEDIIGGTQDNGTPLVEDSTSGTNAFTDIAGGDGGFTEIDDNGDYIITTYPGNNSIVRETASGSYQISSAGGGTFINQAGLDKNLDVLYTNASSGASYVIERISNFTSGAGSVLSANLVDPLLNSEPIAFKASPFTTGSTKLFVGLKNGSLLRIDNAEGGLIPSFNDITGSGFLGSVSDIEFGQSESEIFVTMHNYGVTSIWFTDDGGATWVSKEGNLPDFPVKCILQNPLLPNELIIGTELGIWATADYTVSSPNWIQSYDGMSDVTVLDLDLKAAEDIILATTHGRGMFTSQFTSSPLATQENVLETGVNLYPSVTSGLINIKSSQNFGNTKLEVYSLGGQKVYSAIVELTINNTESLTLGLSSGLYLVKFTSENNISATKKIVIK
ncbi:MAG: T9SS type A sorting domain-containing protein [Flavobacteriaceae bacterium]|nr:T9SS type A sorting domain-containing protein [Bacteroidia bacterium]NNL15532.1 T9SS type A sorting domain-containing protein [Flavobacteriaceae bacterium]